MTVHMDPRGVEVSLEMEGSIVMGQQLVPTIAVRNSSASPISLRLPMGADPKRLFAFTLAPADGGVSWPAADIDPRSFAAEVKRELQPGETHRRRVEHLHFFLDGQWTRELPVGRYRLSCTFDQRSAAFALFTVEPPE